jgi:hypothetical protein
VPLKLQKPAWFSSIPKAAAPLDELEELELEELELLDELLVELVLLEEEELDEDELDEDELEKEPLEELLGLPLDELDEPDELAPIAPGGSPLQAVSVRRKKPVMSKLLYMIDHSKELWVRGKRNLPARLDGLMPGRPQRCNGLLNHAAKWLEKSVS